MQPSNLNHIGLGEPTPSIAFSHGCSMWMHPQALSITRCLTSLARALIQILNIRPRLQMFSANTWWPVAFVERTKRRWVETFLNHEPNAMGSDFSCAFKVESSIAVFVGTTRPAPTLASRSLAWGLVNLGPESLNVARRERRKWFRLLMGHLISCTDLGRRVFQPSGDLPLYGNMLAWGNT